MPTMLLLYGPIHFWLVHTIAIYSRHWISEKWSEMCLKCSKGTFTASPWCVQVLIQNWLQSNLFCLLDGRFSQLIFFFQLITSTLKRKQAFYLNFIAFFFKKKKKAKRQKTKFGKIFDLIIEIFKKNL